MRYQTDLQKGLWNCRLYGFVDTAYLAGRDAGIVAQMLVDGGADIIQVRAKQHSREEIAAMARAILPIVRPKGVPLIINDYSDLVREVDADGVHLGQDDLNHQGFHPGGKPVGLSDRIFGISTHSLEQALEAEQLGADYIGVGPIFPTGTKPGRPAVGLDLIRQVASRVRIPFVCIGGINTGNIQQVKAAGARWVAVVSAILCAEDVVAETRNLKQSL